MLPLENMSITQLQCTRRWLLNCLDQRAADPAIIADKISRIDEILDEREAA